LSDLPPFSNETLRSIRNRRSVRTFSSADVNSEQVEALLKAANDAPSAHNQQSWRFTVVRGERKQRLARLVSDKSVSFPKPASALLRMAARSILSAPVVIAVSNTGELIEHGTRLFSIEKEMARDFFRTMEIQSSAAAVENMLLAATSLGLSTVWLGILFLIKDDVLRHLEEREGEFMAVVPLGYASRPASGPQKKPFGMKVRFLE
jgi:nitroreductase